MEEASVLSREDMLEQILHHGLAVKCFSVEEKERVRDTLVNLCGGTAGNGTSMSHLMVANVNSFDKYREPFFDAYEKRSFYITVNQFFDMLLCDEEDHAIDVESIIG